MNLMDLSADFYVISHWFCRLVFIILFVAFATATAATTTAAAVVTTATATGRVSDCLDEVSQRDLAGLVRWNLRRLLSCSRIPWDFPLLQNRSVLKKFVYIIGHLIHLD